MGPSSGYGPRYSVPPVPPSRWRWWLQRRAQANAPAAWFSREMEEKNGKLRPPQNCPLTDRQEKLSQTIKVATSTILGANLSTRGFNFQGEWVKYNQHFICLSVCFYLFRNSSTGRTRRQIFALDGLNDAESCLWGVHWYCTQNFLKPQLFMGLNRRFQVKHAKYWNSCSGPGEGAERIAGFRMD